jgi:polysaccharide biosynthesis/export protein
MNRIPIAVAVVLLASFLAAGQDAVELQAKAERSVYALGSDDQITIRVLNMPDISDKPVRIDADGYIKLPVIGSIKVIGLTLPQLEANLIERLKVYLENPDVVVSVAEFHSQPVSIVGEVTTPGVHQIQGTKTLIEILALAGGLHPEAGPMLRITRRLENGRIPLPAATDDPTGKFSQADVSLPLLLGGKSPESNIVIRPHDIISVPRAEIVYVLGEIGKAGPLVLHDGQTISVLQAISASGGLMKTAAPGNVKILRPIMGGPKRAELSIDVKKMLNGQGKDLPLLAGDILIIPSSTGRKAAVRAIESAVQAGTLIATYGIIR